MLLLAVGQSSASALTWGDSAGNTDWGNGASWTGGTAPDSGSTKTNTAIFNSVQHAQPNLTRLTRIAGVDFRMADGGLNFTGDQNFLLGSEGMSSSGQISGTNTLSVKNIQLNNPSVWRFFSDANHPGTSTFTIESTVNLNGNKLTITGKRNSTPGNVGVVHFNGVISGDADILVYPDNFRTQTYFTARNTYNGTTSIRGFLNVNSLENAGMPSALGSGGDIVIGNTGNSAQLVFNNLVEDSATDRRVLFQGTSSGGVFALVNNSVSARVSFTDTRNIGPASSETSQDLMLRFGGTNTGLNSFAQRIDNRENSSGMTHVLKEGTGTWVLLGDNTYTGATTVTSGTLLIHGDHSAATGDVTVAAGATLGGKGKLRGNLALARGAFLAPDMSSPLILGGTLALDRSFGVTSLHSLTGGALDWSAVRNGSHPLIAGPRLLEFRASAIRNFGAANAQDIGNGRSAYFHLDKQTLLLIVR